MPAKTVQDIETNLAHVLAEMCSACPAVGKHEPMTEVDFDAVGLALAGILRTCSGYLTDAGFETDAVEELATQAAAVYQAKLKAA